jgi:hypothetical protein
VGNMSTLELLFQWTRTIEILTKCVDLVQSEPHHHLIEN